MTAARAQAYGRVMHALREVGAAKLLPAEREVITEVADTLLFAGGAGEDETQLALLEVDALIGHLVDSQRWTAQAAERLQADLESCGPAPVAALPRAA